MNSSRRLRDIVANSKTLIRSFRWKGFWPVYSGSTGAVLLHEDGAPDLAAVKTPKVSRRAKLARKSLPVENLSSDTSPGIPEYPTRLGLWASGFSGLGFQVSGCSPRPATLNSYFNPQHPPAIYVCQVLMLGFMFPCFYLPTLTPKRCKVYTTLSNIINRTRQEPLNKPERTP